MANASQVNNSGIRDNQDRGSVGEFLQDKIRSGSKLSIVSAYFTIYAYKSLKPQLDQIDSLEFLFGEPRFIRTIDQDKTDTKAYKIEDDGIKLSNRLTQRQAARECAEWITQKAEIRSIRQSNLMHGKMYHVDNAGVNQAILGSSNFTLSGLGLSESNNNIELNLVVDSDRDRQDLKSWFTDLWNNEDLTKDVKQEVLDYLDQLYHDNSPEFIYFKTLYHLFEQFLAGQESTGLSDIKNQIVDTDIWKELFDFQRDGVKGVINKILAYNGCILADSVGLGKTYEALAVIKYFELRNYRVLVLCPKRLRENWTIYQAHVGSELNPFINDRFGYTVLSHTDLSRQSGYSGDIDLANFHWGNYDLVVIDESHNFRNDTPGRRNENNIYIKSRYEKLMTDIINEGVHTKVLLLSATPVNNSLKDLRNQIYFLTGNSDNAFFGTLGIASIKDTLAGAQRTFADWAKSQKDRQTKDLISRFNPSFFKLLDALTIARSRKHVEKYFTENVALLGGFPKRLKPESVFPRIDLKNEFMSYDMVNERILGYKLSLFNPSAYLKDEFRHIYDSKYTIDQPSLFSRSLNDVFSQSDREFFLIGMMKVNFLKRLESSVHSFDITLKRTVEKIDNLIALINRFKEYQAENPEVDLTDLMVSEPDDEDSPDTFEVGKLKVKLAHIKINEWLSSLQNDRHQLHSLELSAKEITPDRDAKLHELKKRIQNKVENPTTDKDGKKNRKLLVFTAYADTAAYLYKSLSVWAETELGINVALVSGGTEGNKTTLGRPEFHQILANFSPRSNQRAKIRSLPQDEEIDLLIATDCLSEGVNLQDCDAVINYDVHWNPVRVCQRFGRIDRIGSRNHTLQLVNFWPTEDLDQYIALKTRVEARMALVDIVATNEDNLLSNEEVQDLVKDDLKFRDKQLRRMKDEILDLEDFDESISLTDFTLDDFRMELDRYMNTNKALLEKAPLGLYAVVPADTDEPLIKPGVIYCLKQNGESEGTQGVNPLQPFFMVYVQQDGTVRLGFTHPKQILEIYRLLCSGKSSPIEELCTIFNHKTNNGEDMTAYSELLEKSVAWIEKNFKKRAAGALAADRSALLPIMQAQVSNATDFELITWLVIL